MVFIDCTHLKDATKATGYTFTIRLDFILTGKQKTNKGSRNFENETIHILPYWIITL